MNNNLGRSLGLNTPVQYEEDYTIIPVNIVKNGKVSHEIESGIRTFCNHLEVKANNCTECGDFVEMDCA